MFVAARQAAGAILADHSQRMEPRVGQLVPALQWTLNTKGAPVSF